jgi:glycosyltransferase involved in cell wall biosynthesis
LSRSRTALDDAGPPAVLADSIAVDPGAVPSTMRILLLHNRYRMPGGEERAVSDLRTLLQDRGHEVALLERHSSAAGAARAGRALLQGGIEPGQVAEAVRALRADIVHAHNIHPLFGWRALAAARESGARTVVHLHNFRTFCAIAIGYRDGALCFRCRGQNTLPGLRLRCRGSLVEAVPYAIGLSRQQRHLFAHADRFIAVSDAAARRLIELGLPADKTSALVNFVPATKFASASRAGEGRYALVSGRLVEEKGFDTAIAAARAAGVPLVIAGQGPDERRLRALSEGADVRFTGWLTEDALAELRARAAVVLVPSRWEEPCPYSVLDSLAAGVPVLAANIGGLPELVGEPVAAGEWPARLERLWADPELRRTLGEEALTRARDRHGPEAYHNRLMELYERR